MNEIERPLSPHLQIYRWQITMVLSILHRATGLFMSIGLLILVGWLIAAATGPESYTRLRDLIGSVPGLALLTVVTYSFCYHLCNGVRHLFWDAGMGFEKPQFRASGWAVVAVSLVMTLAVMVLGSGLAGGAA